MDTQVEARGALRALSMHAVEGGHIGANLAQRDLNIALQDLESFGRAMAALDAMPAVHEHYGKDAVRDLALKFAHKYCSGLKDMVFDDVTFDSVWQSFVDEIVQSKWNYIGVAHLQNFETDFRPLDLGDGISIQLNPNEIQSLMGWIDPQEKLFQQEASEIMSSHYSMVVLDQVTKSPSNVNQIAWEGLWKKANRALRSLRLLKPGDVRIGRIWLAQPASFSILWNQMQSVGMSMLRPGTPYYLAATDQPRVAETYELLSAFESSQKSLSKNKLEELPNFEFALRAFDTMCERQYGRGDDQTVDAITALEALFKIQGEQSFRTAMRTAGLIAANDQERGQVFKNMREYYEARSAIVHGRRRTANHEKIIQNNGPLRNFVQRLLLGFLRLTASGMREADIKLWEELEEVILNSSRRENLRRRMGLTELEDSIRKRAYQLYQQRGGIDGYAETDWLKAEAEIFAAREESKKSISQRLLEMASEEFRAVNEKKGSSHETQSATPS
jgi:5-carboxymethyl-2-hydroxymuconate isomerase